MPIFGALALDDIQVEGTEPDGELSGLAVADSVAVQFPDRGHFRGGAGKEGFIGCQQLVPGQIAYLDGDAQVSGQLDDRPRVMPRRIEDFSSLV